MPGLDGAGLPRPVRNGTEGGSKGPSRAHEYTDRVHAIAAERYTGLFGVCGWLVALRTRTNRDA